jgi:hypothetical protein
MEMLLMKNLASIGVAKKKIAALFSLFVYSNIQDTSEEQNVAACLVLIPVAEGTKLRQEVVALNMST